MRRWLFGSACMVVGILIGVSVRDVPVSAAVECSQTNGDVDGDAKLGLSDVILMLQYIFLPEAQRPSLLPRCAHPCPLPATGQTECYDADGNVIDCASEDYPGQDGFYQAGCPTEERFVDNGDGTVTDNCTGLMWQQETAPGTYNWQQALQYCENLELAGHTDWRLPDIRELQSIVDYGAFDPPIDTRFFGAVASRYWSSSTFPAPPGAAWDIYFWHGNIGFVGKDHGNYVRAVRGGL